MDFLYNRPDSTQETFSFDFSDKIKTNNYQNDDAIEAAPIVPRKRTAAASGPVTRPEDIEFVGERKKARAKSRAVSKVKYLKSGKSKIQLKAFSDIPVMNKILWAFAGILFLRLIFMDSGIYDFYRMDNVLQGKEQELELLEKENNSLVEEIHRIKTSPSYQKTLAREHLGVIEANEFLILFAKD